MAVREEAVTGRAAFAGLLRGLRERALMSQEELAQRAGLSVSTVRGLESGRISRPRSNSLRLLADALDLAGDDRAALIAAARGDRATGAQRAGRSLTPAQLPAAVAQFVGRGDVLATLDRSMPAGTDPASGTVVVSIAGTAGVGKTALAVHWAHRVAHRFPDGQLYIDLRGFAPDPPLAPTEALARFIHQLGEQSAPVPTDLDEAAALFRSLVARKRILMVLDNASNTDQVRPLLPGGFGSMVVVTSREQLDGLVARDGARPLTLDVLAPEEARALVASTLGEDLVRTEPDAFAQLAELCGYLPLALRIAAANIATHRRRGIADLVAQLRGSDRLAALALRGDPLSSVSAAFDLSYARLPQPARRMFRLLGLVPGPDVTVEAAACLADTTVEVAEQLLEVLASANLIEEYSGGRYACHDLLRHYAVSIVEREEDTSERTAARCRLYDYYLHRLDEAARLLYPEKLRLPVPDRARLRIRVAFADGVQALAWLDENLPCLIAAVKDAASAGPRQMAWAVADAMRGYFHLRRCLVDWLAVAGAALVAAEMDGHVAGRASAQLSLGDANMLLNRHSEAVDSYQQALSASRVIGSAKVEASVLNNLGEVYRRSGRPREAAEHYAEALVTAAHLEPQGNKALQLGNLGNAYRTLGRLRRAAEHHVRSLAMFREAGNPAMEADALQELGKTYHAMGGLDQAADLLAEAVALHRRVGARAGEADAQRSLSAVYRDIGVPALRPAHAALALARDIGERQVAAEALNTLGSIYQRLGQHGRAIDHHEHALRVAGEIDDTGSAVEAMIGLGTAYQPLGRYPQAHELLGQAIVISQGRGFRLLEGQALIARCALHLATGDTDEALRAGEQALAICRETGYRLGQAHAHLILGHVRRRTGELGHVRQRTGDADTAHHHWRHAQSLLLDMGSNDAEEVAALLQAASESAPCGSRAARDRTRH